jgi:hypothetical protein
VILFVSSVILGHDIRLNLKRFRSLLREEYKQMSVRELNIPCIYRISKSLNGTSMEFIFHFFFSLFSTFSPPHVSSSRGSQQMQFSSLEEWRIIIHGHIIIEKRKACQSYSFPPSGAWTCQQQSIGNSSDHIHLSFRICGNCERYAVRKEKANQIQ